MNRIQRITAAAAISAAVLAPATIAPALAEPYPWHKSDSASGVTKKRRRSSTRNDSSRTRVGNGQQRP
jgi:hypothetical protein